MIKEYALNEKVQEHKILRTGALPIAILNTVLVNIRATKQQHVVGSVGRG